MVWTRCWYMIKEPRPLGRTIIYLVPTFDEEGSNSGKKNQNYHQVRLQKPTTRSSRSLLPLALADLWWPLLPHALYESGKSEVFTRWSFPRAYIAFVPTLGLHSRSQKERATAKIYIEQYSNVGDLRVGEGEECSAMKVGEGEGRNGDGGERVSWV